MAVLVYEHAIATGDTRLLAEGSAMAEAIAMALSEAGEDVVVQAAEGVGVRWGTVVRNLKDALDACDRAVVVAPEEGGVLAEVVERLSGRGLRVLGPDPDAVRTASDKIRTKRALKELGLDVPPGEGDCLVTKPRDSCGSEGVRMTLDREDGVEMSEAMVPGPKCSVLACLHGEEVGVLGVNDQLMLEASGHLVYVGGFTPSGFLDVETARELAEVVGKGLGLEGVFGIDLVVTRKGPVVLEVNPRPTTSVVAVAAEDPEALGSALLGEPSEVSYGSSYLYVPEGFSSLAEMIMDRMSVEASRIERFGGFLVYEVR